MISSLPLCEGMNFVKKGQYVMYIKKFVLVICAVALIIVTALGTVMAVNPFGALRFAEFLKLNLGIAVLENFYYEDVDTEKLLDGVLLGASSSVEDPYTIYMSKDEANSFVENMDSDDYSGVGLYITADEEGKGVMVISPLAGSPAEKAGIASGDIILGVDGNSAIGVNIDKIASDMKGPEGTDVTLTILKKSSGKTIDIKLTRATIKRETVTSKMLDEKNAYINISQFGVNTYSEFAQHYNNLIKQGMKRLVIDLRNNPGGYMEVAVNIADSFIDEGEIVYTLDKDGDRRDYTATVGKSQLPMVVLTNGGSASASEILVGALRAYDIATIVGEKTFGKGVTQIPYKFWDGSIMKITDSKYYTPDGVCIDHQGITPDVEVKMSIDDYSSIDEADVSRDIQLKKAIEILEEN